MVSAAIGVASLVPEVVCHRALRYKRPAPLLPLRLILSTANDQSNRTTPLFQLSTQTFNLSQNEGRLRKLWMHLRRLRLRTGSLQLQLYVPLPLSHTTRRGASTAYLTLNFVANKFCTEIHPLDNSSYYAPRRPSI